MTSSDIDRIEHAARSVFGHEDASGETARPHYALTERILAYLQRKFLPPVIAGRA